MEHIQIQECLSPTSSGQTGWSHTENQHVFPLASHLTPGPESKWPSPTLADSEVNLTNLVGHRRLLLLSLSLSLFLCLSLSNHLFGACGRASRNGELWLVPLRSNHSLQRVSCFSLSRWQRGGKWSPTPPRLNSCTSDPDETDISLHLHCPRSSLAAHAEPFFIKKEEKFTKK